MYLTRERREYYMTQQTKLKEELAALRKTKQDLAQEIAGYEEKKIELIGIKEDINRVKAQIDDIQHILDNSTTVERQSGIDDVVDLGDIATLEFVGTDRVKRVKLVSTYVDANDTSISSPLGKAIYLKRLGDECEYEARGKTLRVRIIGLENVQDIKDEQERV